jgi:hypothetical protein
VKEITAVSVIGNHTDHLCNLLACRSKASQLSVDTSGNLSDDNARSTMDRKAIQRSQAKVDTLLNG